MTAIIGWLTWLLVDAALLLAPLPATTCDPLDGKHITDCGLAIVLDATWPPHLHDAARAIVACESGGNTRAYNAADPAGGSRGLFQINGSNRGLYTGEDIHDPLTNARVAHRIYERQGWRAWWHCSRRAGLR